MMKRLLGIDVLQGDREGDPGPDALGNWARSGNHNLTERGIPLRVHLGRQLQP